MIRIIFKMINRLLIRSSDTVATKIKLRDVIFCNDNLLAAARGLYMDRVYI